jgi:uncharacterized membrane protein
MVRALIFTRSWYVGILEVLGIGLGLMLGSKILVILLVTFTLGLATVKIKLKYKKIKSIFESHLFMGEIWE